jgi:hypothetical protein
MDDRDEGSQSLNWTAVAALYAGLSVGIVWMIYGGHYRNAVWLALIGTGGGLTAYGRVLESRGRAAAGQRWQWAAGVVYAAFVVWAGAVLMGVWVG